MEAVAIILIVCAALKAASIINAIRWLSRHGEQYRVALAERRRALAARGRELDPREHFAIALKLDGDFFPFGYKDVRLRSSAVRRLFRRSLGNLGSLSAVGAVVATVGVTLALNDHRILILNTPATAIWLLYAFTIVLLVCALLIAIEAIYAYATLHGYVEPFHFQRPHAQTSGAKLLLELRYVLGAGAVAAAVATAGVYTVAVGQGGFAGIPRAGVQSLGMALDRLVDSLYFVTSTFATVGYGDIHAISLAARLLVIVSEVAFFLLIGVSLAMLALASGGNLPEHQ